MFLFVNRSGKLIEPIYQVWEEPSDCMMDVPKKNVKKVLTFCLTFFIYLLRQAYFSQKIKEKLILIFFLTSLRLISQESMEDEDDFLHGETPKGDTIMGMTPGSYDSHLHSPRSVGSPPISFLQRPFWTLIVTFSRSQMSGTGRRHIVWGRSRSICACVSTDQSEPVLQKPLTYQFYWPLCVSSFSKPSI